MSAVAELLARAAFIGIGGAAAMDVWGLVVRRAFGIQGLDYTLLGRWIGHFPRGRFIHERIAAADPVPGERVLGWVAHYSIGIAFAIPLLVFWGPAWGHAPSIGPAMIVAFATIAAPWLVMQPAMGAGFAASGTPQPRVTRLRNIATHAVYGFGLYGSALGLSLVWG